MKRFITATLLALLLTAPALAQEAPVAPQLAPAGPIVTLHTTMGDIQVTLEPEGAPKTAAQFLALVKSGHYNGAAVYRIEPGFVIQLGDLDAKLDYRAPEPD